MFGDELLASVWPCFVQARIKRGRRSLERFQGHRASDISDASEPLRAQDRQSPDGVHRLSTVKQGEPFLGFQLLGSKFRAMKCFAARQSFALLNGTQAM